jgi:hypothetical protein
LGNRSGISIPSESHAGHSRLRVARSRVRAHARGWQRSPAAARWLIRRRDAALSSIKTVSSIRTVPTPFVPSFPIVPLARRPPHSKAQHRTRRIFENGQEEKIDAPPCLRCLAVKQAVKGKPYLGSAFRRDGVDELHYGEWVDIAGVQITFTPSILLQHALGAAHLP